MMINNYSIYDAAAVLSGVVLLGMFVAIGMCLYLAYARLDEMLDSLKNCAAITSRTPLRSGGVLGKLLLVGGISGVVTFPERYLKSGRADTDDLEKLPGFLRRLLVIIQWLLIIDVVGAVVCFFLIRLVR